jgi:long-chain acyl-CoA synthetase
MAEPPAWVEPTRFGNLGDAIDRTGDPDAPAMIISAAKGAAHLFIPRIRSVRRRSRARVATGLEPGEWVAILSANRAEFLASVLVAMRPGLVAVPVNWKLLPATVTAILDDCAARLLLCDKPRRPLCPPGLRCVTFGASPPRRRHRLGSLLWRSRQHTSR